MNSNSQSSSASSASSASQGQIVTGRHVSLLRRTAVEQITGLSRSLLYEKIKKGTFPPPVPLSANRVGWLAHEVQEWIEKMIKLRKCSQEFDLKL